MEHGGRRRHLAQVGNLARQGVDISHGEVDLAFLGGRQQVQDGVRRTSHRDVKAHGVVERRLGGDGTWEDGGVVLVVPALGQGDDGASGRLEEFATIRVGGQQGTVAGQGEAEGLRQAVHRVGSEHA